MGKKIRTYSSTSTKYCSKVDKDGTNHNNGECIPGGVYKCEWCSFTTKSGRAFRNHQSNTCKNIPSGRKQPLKRCKFCHKSVKKDGTNHNNRKCIPGGVWKCDLCSYKTLSRHGLLHHRNNTCKKNPSSKINTHPATAKCKSNVRTRLRSRNNPKNAFRKAKLSFRNGICRICKTTVDLKNVSSHGKGNCTRSSQWGCHICRSRLTSRSDLIKHRLSNCKHQSKVTKKSVQKRKIKYSRFGYPCGHCGYMDTSFKLISMHLRILHRIECDTIYPDLVQDFGCYCCGEIFSSPASAFVHASACSLKLEKPKEEPLVAQKILIADAVPVESKPIQVMEQTTTSPSPTLNIDVNCPVQAETKPAQFLEGTPTSDTTSCLDPISLGPSLCLVAKECLQNLPCREPTKPRANEALYKMELQEKGLFICCYCKTVADLKEFDQHQEYSCPRPADQQWFCKKCKFKTSSKVGLYKHIKTGCKLPETGFPCDRCMYVGSAWEDTFSHYGLKHGKFVSSGAVEPAKELKFTCFRCGYGSNSRLSVIVHMMNHLDKKVE